MDNHHARSCYWSEEPQTSYRNLSILQSLFYTRSRYWPSALPTTRLKGALSVHAFPTHDNPLMHLGLCFLCHSHCPHTPKDKHVRNACRSNTSVMDGVVFPGFPSSKAWKLGFKQLAELSSFFINWRVQWCSPVWKCLTSSSFTLLSRKHLFCLMEYFSHTRLQL